jgi:hypothetical protein
LTGVDDMADLWADDGTPRGIPGAALIERAVLNESEVGRRITSEFVRVFGDFVTALVRPELVDMAARGEEPQLLINGLAELLRSTAEAIEFPLDHPRAGSPAAAWIAAEAEDGQDDDGTAGAT